jgi:ribokinase
MTVIAVVGSLNHDVTIPVEVLPHPGETVMAVGPVLLGHGGKGGNQASAAAAMGGDVVMVARVGDDDAAALTRADLVARGVMTSLVRTTAGSRTGTATIIVDKTGDNIIVVDAGANASLSTTDVSGPLVSSAAVVLVQLEIPLETVKAAVRNAGGLVVLNPAPAQALDEELLAAVDVVVPNRHELGRLSGQGTPGSVPEVLAMVERLPLDFDVVVTLGPDGALAASRRRRRAYLVPSPAVAAVDATGAGDAFCGALAVGLAEHRSLEEAASLAVAAASLSTTAPGARGRLARREEAAPLARSPEEVPWPRS